MLFFRKLRNGLETRTAALTWQQPVVWLRTWICRKVSIMRTEEQCDMCLVNQMIYFQGCAHLDGGAVEVASVAGRLARVLTQHDRLRVD